MSLGSIRRVNGSTSRTIDGHDDGEARQCSRPTESQGLGRAPLPPSGRNDSALDLHQTSGPTVPSMFTDEELAYLESQRIGRLATSQPDGTLQNNPVGFGVNQELGTID